MYHRRAVGYCLHIEDPSLAVVPQWTNSRLQRRNVSTSETDRRPHLICAPMFVVAFCSEKKTLVGFFADSFLHSALHLVEDGGTGKEIGMN